MLEYAENLWQLARDLLLYCRAQTSFDNKHFAMKMKNFEAAYKRCDQATQGHYHALWCERLSALDEV